MVMWASERRAQAVDDAALHLLHDASRIDDTSAINRVCGFPFRLNLTIAIGASQS